ncbi:MAG: DUF1826 domain-containing protein [Bacteriovoracaceae bacterium]|nr:DUF1826 domain-containing protein [Bacteriovoracaceae bacterium]
MQLQKKKAVVTRENNLYTSYQRKINDLEYDEVSSVTWVRQNMEDIKEYLSETNLSDFPSTVCVSNTLDDKELEIFFKSFPQDLDEMRRGHEKIIDDIRGLLKIHAALNPKRFMQIKIIRNKHEAKNADYGFNDNEINLVCSFSGPSVQWVETNDYVYESEKVFLKDDFKTKTVDENSVIVFKGSTYPAKKPSPLIYRFHDGCELAILITSYMAEH